MAESGITSHRLGEKDTCTQQETTGFVDGEKSWINSVDSNPDVTFQQANTINTDLADFLRRPVKIKTYTLAVGGTLDVSIQPWVEFFLLNEAVAAKIKNYYLLRSKMMVKFVVNASPFIYGRILASYKPMSHWDSTLQGTSNFLKLHQRSQLPNVELDISENTGGCLCLPFFYPKNGLDTSETTPFFEIGTIHLNTFVPLRSANGGTGDITVSVYAWAEDVELAVPTTSFYQPQADEYQDDGVISKPASALASVASKLTSVPVIGEMAMATSIGASAVASIARLFGYSRPNNLEKPKFVRNYVFSNLASTDLAEPINSLAVDSKNELTLDPRTTGLSSHDELSILSIAQKETFILERTWATTAYQTQFSRTTL